MKGLELDGEGWNGGQRRRRYGVIEHACWIEVGFESITSHENQEKTKEEGKRSNTALQSATLHLA
jgi:hypothetical protein